MTSQNAFFLFFHRTVDDKAVNMTWMALDRTTFDAQARIMSEAKCLTIAFRDASRPAQKIRKHRADHDSCHLQKGKKRKYKF
jgi:hypothetical protein